MVDWEKSRSQCRETWFSFSSAEVEWFVRLIGASNDIDRVSRFNNSLSFGAKQKSLGQIFFVRDGIPFRRGL